MTDTEKLNLAYEILDYYNVIISEYCNIRYYVNNTKTTTYNIVSKIYEN